MNSTELITAFVNDPEATGTAGHYSIQTGTDHRLIWSVGIYTETLALRCGDIVFSNGGRMNHGRKAWGNRRGQSDQQRMLENLHTAVIPFDAIGAMLCTEPDVKARSFDNIERMDILDIAGAETLQVIRSSWNKEIVPRHFFGTTLLSVKTCDNKKHTLLIDCDRAELKHNRFNAFITECIGEPLTIAEAYEGLKPEAVKSWERNHNIQAKRQGEYFFLPCAKQPKVTTSTIDHLEQTYALKALDELSTPAAKKAAQELRGVAIEGELSGTNNTSSHKAQHTFTADGISYAKGKIEHTRGEHEELTLSTWHTVHPSTALKSITLGGDVD